MPKYPGVRKKRNRWYFRIQHNGKRIENGGYICAEDAYVERVKCLNNLQSKKLKINNITLTEFIQLYIKQHDIPGNRSTTLKKTRGICNKHIIPVLGDQKLSDLENFQLVMFKNTIVRNKTPSVAYDTMRTLKKVLNKAVEWDFLAVNPLKTKLPGEPKTEHPILEPARLFEMIDQLEGRDKYIIATAGYVGLRRAEIAGLKWPDFNFKDLTLNLRRQYVAGEIVVFRDKKVLKTHSSKSCIPLWSKYVLLMKKWRLQCGSPEWVFKGRKEKPMSMESWGEKRWPRIQERFNLPEGFRLHDLRHTFASILLAEGAQPGDVQKLLRHASIQTTMNIYRHILPGQLERNFEIFSKLYGEHRGERQDLIQ